MTVAAVDVVRAAPTVPAELQVEVTAACNLRCRMCLVRYRPPINRVTGSMPFERFTRLVDELPGVEKVTLQGLGEPLLAPDLVEMVRYASARGAKVGFNTNATLLTREKALALIEAGLDWLHVSVDGATAATYESIRDGASFTRVARNVKGLMAAIGERGAARPVVQLVFVAQRSNVAELPALVRLAAEWGVPEVRVQNLSHDFSDTEGSPGFEEIRAYVQSQLLWSDEPAVFGEAAELAAELGVALRLPEGGDDHDDSDGSGGSPAGSSAGGSAGGRAVGEPGCDWPWRSTYVMHDGVVQPCCMVMGADRAVVGHADDGIDKVWRGDALERFREALLSDTPPDVCRGCAMYRHVF